MWIFVNFVQIQLASCVGHNVCDGPCVGHDPRSIPTVISLFFGHFSTNSLIKIKFSWKNVNFC